MKLNIYQKICLYFYFLITLYWVYITYTGTKDGFNNYFYSFLFGLVPLIGGIAAMVRSRMWGGLKSAVGKAVFFIGLGLFCWGSGETIWSYYNFFLGEPAPYPSIADLGFAPSIFFYGLGAAFLSKATGAKYGLRNKYAKAFFVAAPFIVFVIAWQILVNFARGGVLIPPDETPLKLVLDIVYPLGGFLSLTVAVIVSGLSFKYFGGKFKYSIISILVGLFVMFIADTTFSYTTTVGSYYNANFGDLMLSTGLFFLTFGVLGFATVPKQED